MSLGPNLLIYVLDLPLNQRKLRSADPCLGLNKARDRWEICEGGKQNISVMIRKKNMYEYTYIKQENLLVKTRIDSS